MFQLNLVRRLLASCALLCAVGVFAQTPAAAPIPTATAKPASAYTLSTTDKLNINVFQEEELNTLTRIDAKGCVNLKLVGDVRVAGMSVSEAQKAIETAYKDGRFLRSPQVTIYVEEYAAREVTVYGQVKNPGRISLPIESSMTLIDLIGKVGGFTDTAKGSAVTITRTTADGKRTVLGPIDVDALNKGRGQSSAADETLIMQPGDIVNVPQRVF